MSKKKTDAPGIDDLPRTVADLVLAGLGKAQIRAFLLAEADYRPGHSELDDLIEAAKRDLAAQAEHYKSIATDLTVVRLNDLYTRALKAQDLKTALEIQKAIVTFLIGKGSTAKANAGTAPEDTDDRPTPRLVGSYQEVMERKRKRA